MKTLLVTGAAGFIGSNFVELAAAKRCKVVVLDALTYAGHLANLEGIENRGEFEFVKGDINDQGLVTRLLQDFQVDAVINFAAESHVDRSIDGPGAFVRTNINGVFNLLDCSLKYFEKLSGEKKNAFRFIQVSTDEVFGTLGDEGKFSETTPYAPSSPYSSSKAAGDLLAKAWFHTYKLPVMITNCSNNYGPKQYPEKLIPHMIACALAGKTLPVYGNGKNVRDWIHVADHCAGVWLALEKGRPGESYCFGGNSERKNLDVVTQICHMLDRLSPRQDGVKYETQIGFVEDRKGHDWRYAIDDTKAQKELGFERRYLEFESGLQDTVEWYLKNEAWVRTVLKK